MDRYVYDLFVIFLCFALFDSTSGQCEDRLLLFSSSLLSLDWVVGY